MTKKNATEAVGSNKTGIGRREFLKTAAAGGVTCPDFSDHC
jgi:hypothetical protein